MDRIIEPLASGLGNGIGWLADHGVLFAAFAALWVAFGAALILSQDSLDQAWVTIRGLPLIVQIVVWVLFLPVMAGLWVWETTWPLAVRVLVIVSVAGWNLLVFLPRALQTARP
jgi:ABC-type amino acid transport system permease subunit